MTTTLDDTTGRTLPLLTNSRAKTFRSCQRKHHYRYRLGVVPLADSEALFFGTLVHHGLEAWWRAWMTDRAADALTDALAAIPSTTDPYTVARLTAMIAGYDARWTAFASTVGVLAVEAEFSAPLVNPRTGARSRTWQLAGKVDAVVRLDDDRVAIVEHKSTSEDPSPGSFYRSRLTMDGQVSTYFVGAASIGFAADVCLYDVLVKPQIRPARATPVEDRKYTKQGALYANQRDRDETADEFRDRCAAKIAGDPNGHYVHAEIVRLDGEIAEHMVDVWQIGRQIRDAELDESYPRNPDACETYGQRCPYFDACSGVASLDDETRFRRLDSVHPELTGMVPVSSSDITKEE